jgi:hypothetical protein
MKLEFADERIKEFADGPLRLVNDGDPIDVSAATGGDLLKAKHWLDGQWVNIFKVAEPDKKTDKEAEQEAFATYPENFPSAEHLAKAGFKHEEALLLDREALLAVKGIGEKGADAVLALREEN